MTTDKPSTPQSLPALPLYSSSPEDLERQLKYASKHFAANFKQYLSLLN